MVRGQIVCMFALAMACGEASVSAPATVPEPVEAAATPVESARPADPAFDDPTAMEPFDFWRVLLDPELEGTEQVCMAARVSEVDDPDRRHMPSQRQRPSRWVSCVRSSDRDIGAANIVVLIPDGTDTASLVPSTRDRRADDIETRLRVRVLGVDARGETVNVELLSVHRVVQSGNDDPTQPPSRCCRDRGRPDRGEVAPGPEGFNFEDWRHHVGTRQLCVAKRPNAPRRTRGVEPAPISIPENVTILMYAPCEHASGRHRVRLLFTEAIADSARSVSDGSLVHGFIDGGGDLLVESVGIAPNERR